MMEELDNEGVEQIRVWELRPQSPFPEGWTELTEDVNSFPENEAYCWLKFHDGTYSKMPRQADVNHKIWKNEFDTFEWKTVSHWKPAPFTMQTIDWSQCI